MDFWRIVYPAKRVLQDNTTNPIGDNCALTAHDVWNLAPSWLTRDYLAKGAHVIGVLARGGTNTHRKSSTHVANLWNAPFPPGSFYALNNNVYISSPCFVFLQMARKLRFAQLIAYGNELCGTYAFDRNNKRGMRTRKMPLITKSLLATYLKDAKGCPGCASATKALPYIIEESASPMETLDEMLMSLPCRYGGYSNPAPTMNEEVPLPPKIARLARLTKCYTDMSWPNVLYDLEHQGLYDHADPQRYDADRRRINALRLMGYEVIELTHEQVADWQAFETLALHTAKVIGHRIDKSNLGLTGVRRDLRTTLFAWNAAYGHPCKQ